MRGQITTNGRTMGVGMALAVVLFTPVDLLCQANSLTLPGGFYAAAGCLLSWLLAAKTGPQNGGA